MASDLLAMALLVAQDDPGRGGDPGGPGGVIVIVVIILLVLAAGAFLARKVFVRDTMPTKPSEDEQSPKAVGADTAGESASADPSAMGRPSDRG